MSATSDAAANDVRDRVSRVRGLLPRGIDEPVVSKIEADAQAIVWLAFQSDRHTALEISDYADRYVADRLKTLPGVLERHHRRRTQLRDARVARPRPSCGLRADASGRGERAAPPERGDSVGAHRGCTQREFTVLSETDLRTPEQFDNLIIAEASGYPVRLKDVGRAELGALDERSVLRVNGNEAVGLGHRQAVHREHALRGARQ